MEDILHEVKEVLALQKKVKDGQYELDRKIEEIGKKVDKLFLKRSSSKDYGCW